MYRWHIDWRLSNAKALKLYTQKQDQWLTPVKNMLLFLPQNEYEKVLLLKKIMKKKYKMYYQVILVKKQLFPSRFFYVKWTTVYIYVCVYVYIYIYIYIYIFYIIISVICKDSYSLY